jgi:hypothetical protein
VRDKKRMTNSTKEKSARQTMILLCVFTPCALEKLHGKTPLCHAPKKMCTVKFRGHGKQPFSRSARQIAHILSLGANLGGWATYM